jgi:hypothetical protein
MYTPALTEKIRNKIFYNRSDSYSSSSCIRPTLISSIAAHKSKIKSSAKLNAPRSDSSIAVAKSLGFFLLSAKSQICCAEKKNDHRFEISLYLFNIPRSASLMPM